MIAKDVQAEPRFRLRKYEGWYEWGAHFGLLAVWGGFSRRWSVGLDIGADNDRLHLHIGLVWAWISADVWWPR
jgi:hypothetical protein